MTESSRASCWVGLIANPTAGRGQGLVKLERLEAALQKRGATTARILTPAERKAAAAESIDRPEDHRVLAVIGGDGTVNALINEWPGVGICHYASGTENLFARAFATPREPEAMADWILTSKEQKMDLGEFSVPSDPAISPRRYALMLGFGFDAAVVNRHHSRRVTSGTGTTSRLAYFGPLAHEAYHYDFPPVRLRWTDASGTAMERVGTTAIVFNFDCYALGLRFAPEASAFDGHLDSVCFTQRGSIRAGLYLAMVASGVHIHMKSVGVDRMREIELEALEKPVPVQMDGDPAGWLEPGKPWVVRCLPKACPVLTGP